MILPKVRDPRFVTIRRGGTLTDSDHHLLALWAALCAEHVLHLFESAQPEDPRPREAIEHARAWVRGEVTMMQARAAGGHAMGAAGTCVGQHGMLRTLPARPRSSHTSPRTNSVRPPMRSRPHVLPRRKARVRAQGDSSAGGSATSSRRRFASSYLTTSGCGTTSAGRCSTAERGLAGGLPASAARIGKRRGLDPRHHPAGPGPTRSRATRPVEAPRIFASVVDLDRSTQTGRRSPQTRQQIRPQVEPRPRSRKPLTCGDGSLGSGFEPDVARPDPKLAAGQLPLRRSARFRAQILGPRFRRSPRCRMLWLAIC